MRTTTVFLISALFAGCYGPTSPGPQLVTVEAKIEGLVSSPSGAVVGADVELGQGGHFGFPKVHTKATTNEAGRYQVAATIQCGWTFGDYTWVKVFAEGFVTRQVGAKCAAGIQRIDISLRVAP